MYLILWVGFLVPHLVQYYLNFLPCKVTYFLYTPGKYYTGKVVCTEQMMSQEK